MQVLDIGTGSLALLAIMAADAGATKVRSSRKRVSTLHLLAMKFTARMLYYY
jgi:predicted nicotinamide N-methyase